MCADEAHIENSGAISHGPIDGRYENMRGRCWASGLLVRAEGAHRQDRALWCRTKDQAVRANNSGDRSAVVVRRYVGSPRRVERARDGTSQVRMPDIDSRVDDSDCNIATEGQLVSLRQPQLARCVLRNGGLEAWALTLLW